MKSLTVFLSLMVAMVGFAETTQTVTQPSIAPAAAAPSTVAQVLPGAGALSATLDIRPSYVIKDGKNNSENLAELDYKVSPNVTIGYRQYFNTTLPRLQLSNFGMSAELQDGLLRAKLPPIFKTAGGLSLVYEPRVYLPIVQAKIDAGYVGTFRNYFILSQSMGPVTLSLMDLPIFHAYNTAGSKNAEGKESANPYFENRVYLEADVAITPSLTFSLPLMFHQTRYATYAADTKKSNNWAYYLWFAPELIYKINPTVAVGVSYYTENLLEDGTLKLAPTPGMEQGKVSGVLQVSL